MTMYQARNLDTNEVSQLRSSMSMAALDSVALGWERVDFEIVDHPAAELQAALEAGDWGRA